MTVFTQHVTRSCARTFFKKLLAPTATLSSCCGRSRGVSLAVPHATIFVGHTPPQYNQLRTPTTINSGAYQTFKSGNEKVRGNRLSIAERECSTLAAPVNVIQDISEFTVVRLASLSMVHVTGPDSIDFLQGLITNDVTCLLRDCTSLYSMLLNLKGRVIFDLMLFKDPHEDNSFFLQVHHSQKDALLKTLKKYKIRKKVVINDLSDEVSMYAAFGCMHEQPRESNQYHLYKDPRLPELGWRLTSNHPLLTEAENISEDLYKAHRYRLGVSEGPSEHLPEKSLPLECNLVLLHGVSFSKGCYLGQELTARSHHTGIIRKRMMPVTLSEPIDLTEKPDIKAMDSDKTVGTLRGVTGCLGIALLRVADVMKASGLYTISEDGKRVPLTAHIPSWWPEGITG